MGVLSRQSRLARSAVSPTRGFGEPVIVDPPEPAEGEDPADPVTVYGVFDPVGDAAQGGIGSDVGLIGRISAQFNPVAWLVDTDAVGIAEGRIVTVRAQRYTVERIDPDSAGIVRLELRRADGSAAGDLARYR